MEGKLKQESRCHVGSPCDLRPLSFTQDRALVTLPFPTMFGTGLASSPKLISSKGSLFPCSFLLPKCVCSHSSNTMEFSQKIWPSLLIPIQTINSPPPSCEIFCHLRLITNTLPFLSQESCPASMIVPSYSMATGSSLSIPN